MKRRHYFGTDPRFPLQGFTILGPYRPRDLADGRTLEHGFGQRRPVDVTSERAKAALARLHEINDSLMQPGALTRLYQIHDEREATITELRPRSTN